MARNLLSVLTASIAAFCLAGCGAGTAAVEPADVTTEPSGPSAAIEPADGRLGGATIVHAGEPARELSSGGPLDSRQRGDGPRRDGVGAGAGCAGVTLAPGEGSMSTLAAATLCLVNGERADRGLATLTANAKLDGVATAYARDLVEGSYFSHTGRDGSSSLDRVRASGYLTPGAGYSVGENLAWGTGVLATPAAIMVSWMNSPGHRQNILNPDYRELGIGIAAGNPGARNGLGATYVNEFGVLEGRPSTRTVSASTDVAAKRATKKRKRGRRARARARAARRAQAALAAARG